jgi:hypothetical protein
MPQILLAQGSRGPEVQELQAALNFHVRKPLVALVPDGGFGPLTNTRLREFQRRAGLTETGTVNVETINMLYRRLEGAIEAVLTPKANAVAFSRPGAGTAGRRSALVGAFPGFGQLGPIIPDFVPPSRVPQTQAVVSRGFDVETKFSFDPIAKPSEQEHPLKLTIAPTLPWPEFLKGSVTLEAQTTPSAANKFTLDAKIKIPLTPKPIALGRLELKPYFFTGAGVTQNHFKELNSGASATIKLKLFDNVAGSGVSVAVEADGGLKFNWDMAKGDGTFKGFFEGGVVLQRRF